MQVNDKTGGGRLTVYTVSYSKYAHGLGLEHNVVGSYLVRGDAIRDCADLVIEKLDNWGELRWAAAFCSGEGFWKAMNKAGFKKSQVEKFFISRYEVDFPKAFRDALKAYLVDAIGDESCYVLGPSDADLKFRFDVDENDVQTDGGLRVWTCVTTGRRTGADDQEFEDAFPEPFLSREDAVNCALDDLAKILDGYPDEQKDGVLEEALEGLRRDGRFEFRIDDATCRVWNVWTSSVGPGRERPTNHA